MRSIVVLVSAAMRPRRALLAQSPREIAFDANAMRSRFPPHFWEKSPVWRRTRAARLRIHADRPRVATLGDERTFYHNGSRLFQFIRTQVRERDRPGVYAVISRSRYAWISGQRLDCRCGIEPGGQVRRGWTLPAGARKKAENINVRPGPGVPASGGRRRKAPRRPRRRSRRPESGRARWRRPRNAGAGSAFTATASPPSE